MISAVDDALRQLILKSLSISEQSVDIRYDLPSRDWASRLNRPTINIFLFDIRENLRLRGAEQSLTRQLDNGKVEIRRNPIRIDLRYLLTAWTKEPEDAHLLLSDALMTLLRNSTIPDEFLSEKLRVHGFPVNLEAAVFQPENGPTEKVTDIWGVIGNDIHAGFIVTVTITVDPFEPTILPMVSSVEPNLGLTDRNGQRRPNPDRVDRISAGFTIKTEKYSPATLSVVLCEQNRNLSVDENFNFTLPPLPAGKYYIDIRSNGKVLKHQQITLPAEETIVYL